MKKRIQVICVTIALTLLCVGAVVAQDTKPMKMNMAGSAHHTMMMAYRHSMLMFARSLDKMAKTGKFEDIEMARNAFAEIKRSMEKMEAIHQSHMSKMSADKMEMMKPMMEKMQAENAKVKMHLDEIERLMQAEVPDAAQVAPHSTALVQQLERMGKSGKKMKM